MPDPFVLPLLVPREGWGATAATPVDHPPPDKPLHEILFTYNVGEKTCHRQKECAETVKELQRLHMEEKGLPDIAYNFIVGGDGKVYEGRGWDVVPEKSPKYPEHFGKSIDIGFLGTYADMDNFPAETLRTALDFIRYSIHQLYLVSERYNIRESEPNLFP